MLMPRKLTLELFVALLFGVTALHAVLTASRSAALYAVNIGFPFGFYSMSCIAAECSGSFSPLFLVFNAVVFYLIAVLAGIFYRGIKRGSYKIRTLSPPKIPEHNADKKEHEEKNEEHKDNESGNKAHEEVEDELLFDKEESGDDSNRTGDVI